MGLAATFWPDRWCWWLVSLSSSGQTAPNYWLNPQNGVNYLVAVQTPQYKLDSIDALQSTPVVVGSISAP